MKYFKECNEDKCTCTKNNKDNPCKVCGKSSCDCGNGSCGKCGCGCKKKKE